MTVEHRSPLPHIGGVRNRWNTCPWRPARTVVTTTHEVPTGGGPSWVVVTLGGDCRQPVRRRFSPPAAGSCCWPHPERCSRWSAAALHPEDRAGRRLQGH